MSRTGLFCLVLCCSGVPAVAAVLDQGDVEFSGVVIDEAPRWTWQIASPDQVWNVDVDDARTDAQGNQVFNLNDKGTLPYLEGHLKEVAVQGGAGMTPVISFMSDGAPLQMVAGEGGSQDTQFRAQVTVHNADTGEPAGQLSFTLEQGLVLTQGKNQLTADTAPRNLGLSGLALVTGDGGMRGDVPTSLMNRLVALVRMNRGSEAAGIPISWSGERVPLQVLSDTHVHYLAAAYASQLSGFTLSWPQEKVPSTWRASLGVTVTLR